MKKPGYYSSGEFMKKAHITKKTLRYYDEHHILKPSFVNENGARFYTDNDFAKLQQILFLKYLSFPLADIKEMTVRNEDKDFWQESLQMQTGLLTQRIEQLSMMKAALEEAQAAISTGNEVDWSGMLELVNLNEMEQKLKKQYLNSSNISARIHMHKEYSQNPKGWFPWLYEQCGLQAGEQVLELGCGDASFWVENSSRIPAGVRISLTDISEGIVREAAKKVESLPAEFVCEVMDAHHVNAPDSSYDLVIANHLLFYCDNIPKVLEEVRRVLKPGGRFLCSTYGAHHMEEVSQLVREYDDRIALSAEALYEIFGKDNGREKLLSVFREAEWRQYEDFLSVDSPEPLIAYILSCHGNQNRYIVDNYPDFYSFVKRKTDKIFNITKDAGTFLVYLT